MKIGIDVSRHNGKIEWDAVKGAGVDFAIVRAGFGMYPEQVDTRFIENVNGATAVGIPVGVYWFSYARNATDAQKEAETCFSVISPFLEKITLPVFFDFEYDSETTNKNTVYSRASRTKIINTFCEFFKNKNIATGYYTNNDYYKNRIIPSDIPFSVWYAQYNAARPAVPCVLIQRTSSGSVSGISGKVDMNENFLLVSRETYNSDTTNNEKNPVKIQKGKHYTVKITGEDISLVCGVSIPNSPQFAVIKCRREGNSSYWHIVAIGEKGSRAGIYREGGEKIFVCEVM